MQRLNAVSIAGISTTLGYDLNGNIITYDAAGGDDTTLTYDARNNVTDITVSTPLGVTTAREQFWYDPDGQRYLGRESWPPVSGEVDAVITSYLGDYEVAASYIAGTLNGSVERIQGSTAVRRITQRDATGAITSNTWQYVHRDHLGSVDAITNASGGVLNLKTTFDPFGSRRNHTWDKDITGANLTTLKTNEQIRYARGFTDHEQLNRTGFVHMNGRVYDTRIGRFVSPDPIVSDPMNSQSYNRYSYVMNSPMSFTDPSGFAPKSGSKINPYNPTPSTASGLEEVVVYGRPGPNFDAIFRMDLDALYRDMERVSRNDAAIARDGGGGGNKPPSGNIEEIVVTAKRTTTMKGGTFTFTIELPLAMLGLNPARTSCHSPLPDGRTVHQNVDELRQLIAIEHGLGFSGSGALSLWLHNVNGPQNYKSQLGGTDAQGNYNYGATGSLFFSQEILLRAAGAVQLYTNPSHSDGGWPLGSAPYGDQARDQMYINNGINAGCK